MDTRESIKKNLSRLDANWFTNKSDEFKKNKYYEQEEESIVINVSYRSPVYGDKAIAGDKENEYEEREIIDSQISEEKVIINLRKYCSSYLPIDAMTDWGNFQNVDGYGNIDPSNNIQEVADDLVKDVTMILGRVNSVETISRFINKTIKTLNEEVESVSKSIKNATHQDVLHDFYEVCISKLYRKYQNELTVHDFTANHKDTLEFNLSTEELVSLLYIMAKAGILKVDNEHDYTQFLRFAFNHFKVKKKGAQADMENLKIFKETYRRILRDNNGKGLEKIKGKLDPVLREFIK